MKMRILALLLFSAVGGGVLHAQAETAGILKGGIVPVFMIAQGAAIAGMWSVDIARKGIIEQGFFSAQENGVLFWPHVTAEYLTAAALITGGIGLLTKASWAEPLSYVALGALGYTSLNSLNWALAEKERIPYAIPMLVGVAGTAFCLSVLAVK